MPAMFDLTDRRSGPSWSSARISTSLTQRDLHVNFFIIRDLNGGLCGRCRTATYGAAWCSDSHILCNGCSPQLGAPAIPADLEEDSSGDPVDSVTTKRDKDFDPGNYHLYKHHADLSYRHGCAGYLCETYAGPQRTIPANTQFMLSNNDKGGLCLPCFEKAKAKFAAMPARVPCNVCRKRFVEANMTRTMRDVVGFSCQTCLREYYRDCPETDGMPVYYDYRTYALRDPIEGDGNDSNRIYASRVWANANWFLGRDGYYFRTEAEYHRELYAANMRYQLDKVTRHARETMFPYGTNIIKMHGFPAVTGHEDLCLGVELEMQPNRKSNHTQLITALGGKWVEARPYILCRDSSIGEAGVEMITLPYTLANHKSEKYVPWTELLTKLREVGQSGMNTQQCGMHVHINQRALSHLQLGKMMVAINAPEMQELIVTIAQRSEASYCHRYFKKVADGGKMTGGEVHGALSTGKGKGTAELRIFRGNLRYERVMKNLEFAEALCLYANDQSIQRVHMPQEMLAWIMDHRSTYPHLVKFLVDEYKPTKVAERAAARIRASGAKSWNMSTEHLHVEPIEGDL